MGPVGVRRKRVTVEVVWRVDAATWVAIFMPSSSDIIVLFVEMPVEPSDVELVSEA